MFRPRGNMGIKVGLEVSEPLQTNKSFKVKILNILIQLLHNFELKFRLTCLIKCKNKINLWKLIAMKLYIRGRDSWSPQLKYNYAGETVGRN